MILETAPWREQQAAWPASGRHILAHHDDETVIVYQAYSPAIGRYAATHGRFGEGFRYSRMSWVKPNFLWMMHRSDWGRAPSQEVVFAVRLRRTFFENLLASAVASSFQASGLATEEAWRRAVQRSDVRFQWDPDHLPSGQPCARRALQLMRGGLGTYRFSAQSRPIAEPRRQAPAGASHLGSWVAGPRRS